MKVAIIGASGMLGQELARQLKKEKPLLVDRSQLNITDEKSVHGWVAKHKPELVYNTTAYNNVDGAEEDEHTATQVNGEGPGYLATALHAVGGILVHYSTDYVFAGDQEEGYLETDAPNPRSAYGRSKLLGERRVQEAHDTCYIIRLSRLFGRPGTGASAKQSFVEKILDRAVQQPVVQAIDEELSSPTYAPDLAQQSRYIVDRQLPYGIYHVTNAGACTWYGFAQEIFKQKKIKTALEPVSGSAFPRPAPRQPAPLSLRRPVRRPTPPGRRPDAQRRSCHSSSSCATEEDFQFKRR